MVNPAGGVNVTAVFEESMDMHPTSSAFDAEVVTPGTVPEVALRPELNCGVPSSGAVGLTPEYLAMPPELVTAPFNVQV